LGKTKGWDYSDSCQKKRPAHAGRTKKALPVNEGSLGGKEEGGWEEVSHCQEKRHTHACRSKEALRVDESALGSQKESWRQVISLSKLGL